MIYVVNSISFVLWALQKKLQKCKIYVYLMRKDYDWLTLPWFCPCLKIHSTIILWNLLQQGYMCLYLQTHQYFNISLVWMVNNNVGLLMIWTYQPLYEDWFLDPIRNKPLQLIFNTISKKKWLNNLTCS
jgi:hypothetical protein